MIKTAFAFRPKGFFAAALVVMFAIYAPAQSEKVIYSFTGGSDGGLPLSGLTSDSKDNLYGTTANGGANSAGTVFELSPGSSGAWSEQVLYSFSYANTGGASPYGGVVFDSQGNLYGTTAFGGANFQGAVFQLIPGSNGTWAEKVLYSFSGGSDGGTPFAGAVLDGAGNVYGTTNAGGAFGFGTVFQLAPGSNGTWTKKILHSFAGQNDGSSSYESTVMVEWETSTVWRQGARMTTGSSSS